MRREQPAVARAAGVGVRRQLVVADQAAVVGRVVVREVEIVVRRQAQRDEQVVRLVAARRVLSMRGQPPDDQKHAGGDGDSRS
jgi:hypothetical protein